MAGTRRGGLKAVKTSKEKYGKDFYKRIGHLGGVGDRGNARDKGFATSGKASMAGKIAGLKSKRGKAR